MSIPGTTSVVTLSWGSPRALPFPPRRAGDPPRRRIPNLRLNGRHPSLGLLAPGHHVATDRRSPAVRAPSALLLVHPRESFQQIPRRGRRTGGPGREETEP